MCACARVQANQALSQQIQDIFMDSDQTYGVPRVRAELIDAGVHASRKRIARLMRQGHMRGVSRRRSYVVTTQRDKRQRSAPDLVNRRFVAKDINELWVADMTYIPTWAGFLYLAMVLDVYSRKVVGWAFGERMTAELVVEALNMALHTRKPGCVIHHSDQGSRPDFPCPNDASRHGPLAGVRTTLARAHGAQSGWLGDSPTTLAKKFIISVLFRISVPIR